MWDVDTIYKIPRMLHEQGLDEHRSATSCSMHTPAGQPDALGQAGRRARASAARGDDRAWSASTSTCPTRTSRSPKRCATPASTTTRGSRSSTSTRRPSSATSVGQPRRASTRSWCPAASASAASKARSRAIRYARENKHAVPRHLPRHAGRDDRVRAPHGRPRRRQQHRVRSRHAAPGDRADHRMAGPRRHDRAARRAIRPRRHDAPRRAELPTSSPARWPHEIYGDVGHRAPPPPLRGQRPLPRPSCSEAGLRDLGAHASARS